jgi:hypothetical protein
LRNKSGKRNLVPEVLAHLPLRKYRFSIGGVAPGLQLSEATFDTQKTSLGVTRRFSMSPVVEER